jgi:hypothetical protein
MRILGVVALLVLTQGLLGCGGRDVTWPPLAPSRVTPAVSQPVPVSVLVFTDARTGFATSDVRDAQEQILQFNSAGEIIWTVDGRHFPGYWINGRIEREIGAEVVFATKDGQRRAYLIFRLDYHHYEPPPHIVDLEVVGDHLVIIGDRPPVPLPGT